MEINKKKTGFVLYGLTPPKSSTSPERLLEISLKQKQRIQNLDLDGLILYDIQDESSRTDQPRPFPYMSTIAPEVYCRDFLSDLAIPKIVYQSVGKFTPSTFNEWLTDNNHLIDYAVFVGSPSIDQKVGLSLKEAYSIKEKHASKIELGGVTIPERHHKKQDEHIRLQNKMNNGCSFFVSQCIYSINQAKDFLSDYYYYHQELAQPLAPIIFTLTPCGSHKTLEFLGWLGIDIPTWLKNELIHTDDILALSIDVCKEIARDLTQYCVKKNIPFGFNIESVAIRKAEIDASIELVKYIQDLVTSH